MAATEIENLLSDLFAPKTAEDEALRLIRAGTGRARLPVEPGRGKRRAAYPDIPAALAVGTRINPATLPADPPSDPSAFDNLFAPRDAQEAALRAVRALTPAVPSSDQVHGSIERADARLRDFAAAIDRTLGPKNAQDAVLRALRGVSTETVGRVPAFPDSIPEATAPEAPTQTAAPAPVQAAPQAPGVVSAAPSDGRFGEAAAGAFLPRDAQEAALRMIRGTGGDFPGRGTAFASPEEVAGLLRSTATASPAELAPGGVVPNSPEAFKPENFSAAAQARQQAMQDAENAAILSGGKIPGKNRGERVRNVLLLGGRDQVADAENMKLFDDAVSGLREVADSGSLADAVKDMGYRATAGMNGMFGDFYQFGADMTKDGAAHDVLAALAKATKEEQERNRAGTSLATQAQDQLLNNVVDDPDSGAWDVVKAAARNPRATSGMIADSTVPSILPMLVGGGAARIARLGGASARDAVALGTRIPVLSEAAQNFAQTSNELEGDRGQKLFAGGIAGLTTLLAGKLTDAGMDGALVRRIAGFAQKSPGVLNQAGFILKTSGKEAAEEFLQQWGQEVAPYIAKDNLTALDADALQRINNEAVMAGVVGAASAAGPSTAASFGSRGGSGRRKSSSGASGGGMNPLSILDRMGGAQEERSAQQEAPKKSAREDNPMFYNSRQAQPAPKPASAEKLEFNAEDMKSQGDGEVVLQNRDRSTPASQQQMNAIAARPDYARVSPSRDFGNGAPVVAYGSVPEAQLGRTDIAVTADGEHIPVQYAVVEGDSVLTSNDVTGQTNEAYASAPPDRMRAIAGNGRMAGLTAAYGRGTAAGYKAEMMADAATHGVKPEVIEGMKKPVLVRVMPVDKIRPDIGDISNTSNNLQMSAVETAKNDVNRVDFNALQFDENGEPSMATLRGFVGAMPATEQGALLDVDGRPTKLARERFKAALFKKAYGNEDLSRLQAQSDDPEIQNILKAMMAVAGRMSQLSGMGDLDLREMVSRAAIKAVNARREGVKLADYAKQAGMFETGDPATDAVINAIVDVFAKNSRSAKEMSRVLNEAASFAYSEATKPAEDMFGEAQKATRQDVADFINKENSDELQQQNLFDQQEDEQGGGEPAGTAEQRQAAGRDERAGSEDLGKPEGTSPAAQDAERQADRPAADARGQGDAGDAEGRTESRAEVEPAQESDDLFSQGDDQAQASAEARPRQQEAGAAETQEEKPKAEKPKAEAPEENPQGALFSRAGRDGGAGSSRSAEDVSDSLRSDRVVGDAFAALEDRGDVVVVSSEDELPAQARAGLRSQKNTRTKFIVQDSLARPWNHDGRVGFFDNGGAKGFPNGPIVVNEGVQHGIDGENIHNGGGAKHITAHAVLGRTMHAEVENKTEAGLLDIGDTLSTCYRVYRTHDRAGKERFAFYSRKKRRVIIARFDGQRFVITTIYPIDSPDAKWGNDFVMGKGALKIPSLSDPASLTSFGEATGNEAGTRPAVALEANYEPVDYTGLFLKESESGAIQAAYDPASGKAYIIASNIKPGDERGVFLHEVGVHMAVAQGDAAQMSPLVRRAQQIVQNGNANGDPLAQRVHQRLEDAGLLDESGRVKKGNEDEAYAYLVEEFANDPARAARPIREWFANVVSRIKAWLYDHGFRSLADHLNERDLTALAVANARAMADMKGRGRTTTEGAVSGPKFSRTPTGRFHPGRIQGETMPNTKERETMNQVSDQIFEKNRPSLSAQPSLRVGNVIATLKSLPARAVRSLAHPVGRDELGHLEFRPGRDLANAIGRGTVSVLDDTIKRLDSVTVGTLGIAKGPLAAAYTFKAAPKNVRIAIREMHAQEWKAFETAEDLAKSMPGWESNKRLLLSDVIEKELQAGTNAPQDVVAVADKMSHVMNDQSEELVRLGMLSPESRERWRDVYLPRFYKKKNDLVNFLTGGWKKSTRGGIGGSHFKMRGSLEAVPIEEFQRKIDMGYELRDPVFEVVKTSDAPSDLSGKTGVPVKGGRLVRKDGGKIRKDDVVHVWRDWTREERQDMGEIRDGLFRFVTGYMQIQHDIALGRLFERLADNPEIARATEMPGFTQVPNTAIEGTGVKRYGKLSGMWLRDDVFATVFPMVESSSALMKIYKKCMSYWKEGKTAMNPVSHMNNIVGNLMFAHLAGLPLYRLDVWSDAVKALAGKGDFRLAHWFQEAKDHGLLTGSFSQEELDRMLPPELRELAASSKAAPQAAMDKLFNILTLGLRDKLGKAYEFEDVFFKTAIYMYARRNGLGPADAVDYALKFIPTYDDLPGGARVLKNSVFPFFSWTYKAMPVLISQSLAHPVRAAAVFGMAHAVNMCMYAMAAGDDDDDWWEKLKKGSKLYGMEQEMLPEYMQGYGLFGNPKFVRLWVDQGTGLPQFWNVSNMIPGGQFWDATNQSGGMPWPEMLTVGNPLWTIALGLGQNRDTFTGREVWEDYDSGLDKIYKGGSFLWRNLAPAVAPFSYHWDRLSDAAANAIGHPIPMGVHTYTGIGRAGQAQTLPSAFLNTAGFKIRDVDFQRETQMRINKLERQNKDIKSAIRRLQRQAAQGSITRDQALRDTRRKLDQLRGNRDAISAAVDLYKLRNTTLIEGSGQGISRDAKEPAAQ